MIYEKPKEKKYDKMTKHIIDIIIASAKKQAIQDFGQYEPEDFKEHLDGNMDLYYCDFWTTKLWVRDLVENENRCLKDGDILHLVDYYNDAYQKVFEQLLVEKGII